MEHAIKNNHLEVVKFLHFIVFRGNAIKYTNDAIDWASKEGHLETVQFFHFIIFKGIKGKGAFNSFLFVEMQSLYC